MQPVPEGYKPLGFAGFTDKGTYTASEVYAKNDIVHNNNTTWRCLVNGTTGIIPAEGANWTVFIASESDSSGITTKDTEGLVGPAGEKVSNQSLIDAIAEKVAKQLVTNTSLANALAGYITKEMMSSDQTDDPDKVPTSALAYAMQQSIDELNGKMTNQMIPLAASNGFVIYSQRTMYSAMALSIYIDGRVQEKTGLQKFPFSNGSSFYVLATTPVNILGKDISITNAMKLGILNVGTVSILALRVWRTQGTTYVAFEASDSAYNGLANAFNIAGNASTLLLI